MPSADLWDVTSFDHYCDGGHTSPGLHSNPAGLIPIMILEYNIVLRRLGFRVSRMICALASGQGHSRDGNSPLSLEIVLVSLSQLLLKDTDMPTFTYSTACSPPIRRAGKRVHWRGRGRRRGLRWGRWGRVIFRLVSSRLNSRPMAAALYNCSTIHSCISTDEVHARVPQSYLVSFLWRRYLGDPERFHIVSRSGT